MKFFHLLKLSAQSLIYFCYTKQLFILLFRTSLQYAISCLKRLNYDRQELEDRRRMAEGANVDVLVWSNDRCIRWVQSIGLKVQHLSLDNKNFIFI